MFNAKDNNNDEEMGFADAYKSEILNPRDEVEDTSSQKLIIILILITIILGLSIFGYIYISNSQKKSDENIEEKKDKVVEPPKSQMLNNIDELIIEDLGSGESDVVDENIDKNSIESKDKYLEQLADLSNEVDTEKKVK